MKYDTDIIINNSSSNSNEEIERTKLRNTSDAHRSFSPLMTDVHPQTEVGASQPAPLSPDTECGILLYGIFLWLFISAALAALPPSFLCPFSLKSTGN